MYGNHITILDTAILDTAILGCLINTCTIDIDFAHETEAERLNR